MNKLRLKQFIDSLLSFGGLIVFMSFMFLIGLAVFIDMGSPIIFSQLRLGKDGKPFYLYKFRTMLELKDDKGNYLPDEKRLTVFGRFLRRYSLDELPELWNVIKGEMSLVGPRPLLMEYIRYYTPEQARRHEIKPGITGWAQINGRNAISWEDKFKLDVWYVDNWSLRLDLEIIFLTILKVLKGEGISAAGHVTMPKFKGKNDG
jgi:lipopolysaccharide/colanic/teichoic acid biosynthesis glycosyltransferase